MVKLLFLKIKEIRHRDQYGDINDRQPAPDLYVFPGLVISGPHVKRVYLVGRQDERVGHSEAHDNGCHPRVDADLVTATRSNPATEMPRVFSTQVTVGEAKPSCEKSAKWRRAQSWTIEASRACRSVVSGTTL